MSVEVTSRGPSPVGATQGGGYPCRSELTFCDTDESTNRTPLRGLAIPDPSAEKLRRYQWLKPGVDDKSPQDYRTWLSN